MFYVAFPFRVLGQVLYLIALIPDLCLLPYFGILAEVDRSVSICPIGVMAIARSLDSFIRLD